MSASAALLVGVAALLAARSVGAAGKWEAPPRDARRDNPIAADEQSIGKGKELYTKNCASCHGPSGKGDGAKAADMDVKPGDLSSAEVAGQSDGALHWKVTNGRRPMPPFEKELSDEERWHVVNYIRTFAGAAGKTKR